MAYDYISEDFNPTARTGTAASNGSSINVSRKKKIGHPLKFQLKPQKQNGSNQVFDFSLGPREGNVRIVGIDSVSSNVSRLLISILGNSPVANNNTHPSTGRRVSSSDGVVGSSMQGTRGDCFYLAEINALRNTKDGQKILNNNIRRNNDGSITVTLPGAVKIRQGYAAKGLKCEVTGTYVITAEALAKAEKQAGKSFSKNDMDTICLEIALENYRAEMVKTNKINGNKETSGNYTAEGAVSHVSSTDLLYGGQTYDAGFILTGNKSDVYYNGKKYNNVQRYTDGQYGYVTRDQMLKQTQISAGIRTKGISEINYLGKEEKDLNNMLRKYEGHEGEYAITCSVRIKKKGSDGVTPQDAGHALSVVKITADTVYVANPWHPDKIEPIPRNDFTKMAYSMSAMEVRNNRLNTTNPQNSMNNLTLILGKLSANHIGIKPPAKINQNRLNSMIRKMNNRRSGNIQNINMNTIVQIFNKASKATLNQDEKSRLNNLLKNIAEQNSTKDIDVKDFEYFYDKFSE